MKRYFAVFIWVVFVSLACAQSEEEGSLDSETQKMTGPYLGLSLNWMVGKWKGEGKKGSLSFSSDLEVSSILDETGLLLRRYSSGGYREVMLLGYDMNSKKNVGTLYDNRFHTGLFTCTVAANELNCSQVISAQGYASQRKYQFDADGSLRFFIEKLDPKKQPEKVLEIAYTKM